VDARRNVERILTAAIRVLSEDAAASMEEIAAASEVHRTTIYRRFPTRDALLAGLLRREFDESRTAISATAAVTPSESALRELCGEVIIIARRYAFLLDHYRPSEIDTAAAGLYVKLFAQYQEAGMLREDLPARWLAGLFGALIVAVIEAHNYMDLDNAAAADLLSQTFLDAARTPRRTGAGAPPPPVATGAG
jgi:AcrR family transcriptional regulator